MTLATESFAMSLSVPTSMGTGAQWRSHARLPTWAMWAGIMGGDNAARWVHVDELHPWDRNPRNNHRAATELCGAIYEFGFTAPIVAQEGTNRILAGHTRQKAMLMLLERQPNWVAPGAPGPGMVPVRFMAVSDEMATRITLADNRLGDIATWDEMELSSLLKELDSSALDHLGFDDDEIAVLLGEWLDPFPEELNSHDGAGDTQMDDAGVARVVIELPITNAQDASVAIHSALETMGMKRSAYTLKVT